MPISIIINTAIIFKVILTPKVQKNIETLGTFKGT